MINEEDSYDKGERFLSKDQQTTTPPKNLKSNKRVKRLLDKHGDKIDNFSVYDHGLGNGMVMERRCTDVCFMLIFILFLAAFVGVSVIAFMKGHIWMLIYPYDGENNYCGYHHPNHPYLYMTNLNVNGEQTTAALQQTSICVQACPKAANTRLNFIPTSQVKVQAFQTIPTSSDKWGVCKPT